LRGSWISGYPLEIARSPLSKKTSETRLLSEFSTSLWFGNNPV